MTKNYNSKMAIGVGDALVKFVGMGGIHLSINENNHLLTYGLGPCVGVAIVAKSGESDVTRLLAHIDMGQIVGASFENLKDNIRRLKNSISSSIKEINISLVTTQSYSNMNNLNDRETELLAILLKEFKQFGISINDIEFSYSSQVQISPKGEISTYTEQELEQHKKDFLLSDLRAFSGYVHSELNVYITSYGAYMGNCSLDTDSTEEEKQAELSKCYWQKYVANGYKLVVAPSFNNPNHLAVYVNNWNDSNIHKYGTIPGCTQVTIDRNISSFKR